MVTFKTDTTTASYGPIVRTHVFITASRAHQEDSLYIKLNILTYMNKEKNSKIAFVHFLYKYTLLWCSSTTSSYDR